MEPPPPPAPPRGSGRSQVAQNKPRAPAPTTGGGCPGPQPGHGRTGRHTDFHAAPGRGGACSACRAVGPGRPLQPTQRGVRQSRALPSAGGPRSAVSRAQDAPRPLLCLTPGSPSFPVGPPPAPTPGSESPEQWEGPATPPAREHGSPGAFWTTDVWASMFQTAFILIRKPRSSPQSRRGPVQTPQTPRVTCAGPNPGHCATTSYGKGASAD